MNSTSVYSWRSNRWHRYSHWRYRRKCYGCH